MKIANLNNKIVANVSLDKNVLSEHACIVATQRLTLTAVNQSIVNCVFSLQCNTLNCNFSVIISTATCEMMNGCPPGTCIPKITLLQGVVQ